MDVTRSNYGEVLKDLESVISESSFLAVDGEFTGLMVGRDVNPFNTTAEYYGVLREGAMKFLFIQFGLCTFKYHPDEKKWTHRAYNFYVFPKPSNRKAVDLRYMSQSSSIDFLASNGFDFNKLFREGIPFLPIAEEEKQRSFLTNKHARECAAQSSTPNKESAPIPIPDEHAAFVQATCKKIDDFIASEATELELPRCNAFVRKLLYQTVEERYATQVQLESRLIDNNRVLFVTNLESAEERLQRDRERREQEWRELEEAVGFSKVIRLLTGSGKMVVGHNMMLDLCHILNQFCSPIPADYDEFKAMLHGSFPSLMDTKYMSDCSPFKEVIKSNMLSDLHTRLSETPYCMPVVESEAENCGYSLNVEKYHEAGFDAFITGLCLIAMANHLDSKHLHPDIATLPLLKPYMNRILLKKIQDSGYMNLVGKDPVLPRDHVFYVTFPREWNQMDIVNLFSPISSVYVAWVNSTSAFVSLFEREKARSVMKLIRPSPDYTVTPYHRYHAELAAMPPAATVPASPTTTKLKRLAAERLQEADKPQAAATLKRKRASLPPKESKFSRRSIDTIPEEDDVLPVSSGGNNCASGVVTTNFEESDVW